MTKKIYCGINKLKKNQKYGTPNECEKKGQVRRYGEIKYLPLKSQKRIIKEHEQNIKFSSSQSKKLLNDIQKIMDDIQNKETKHLQTINSNDINIPKAEKELNVIEQKYSSALELINEEKANSGMSDIEILTDEFNNFNDHVKFLHDEILKIYKNYKLDLTDLNTLPKDLLKILFQLVLSFTTINKSLNKIYLELVKNGAKVKNSLYKLPNSLISFFNLKKTQHGTKKKHDLKEEKFRSIVNSLSEKDQKHVIKFRSLLDDTRIIKNEIDDIIHDNDLNNMDLDDAPIDVLNYLRSLIVQFFDFEHKTHYHYSRYIENLRDDKGRPFKLPHFSPPSRKILDYLNFSEKF